MTEDPIRCRYVDCVEAHPVDDDEYGDTVGDVTCETCRADMGLDSITPTPVPHRPKAVYPLQRATEVDPMESRKEIYLVGSAGGHGRPCVLRASPNRVPLRTRYKDGYKDGYKEDAVEIMKFVRNHLPSGTVEEFIVLLVREESYRSLIDRTLKKTLKEENGK